MKINEVKLKDFNFGDVSGSDESREEKFQELFYDENSKYELTLLDEKKFIIYGRKGTGKTLLASYILEKYRSDKIKFYKLVSYDDYILEKLKEFKYENIKKEEQSLFWRYVFLQQFVELIKESSEKLSWWQMIQRKKLYNFVERVEKQFLDVIQFVDEDKIEEGLGSGFSIEAEKVGVSASSNNVQISTTQRTSVESPYFKKYRSIENEIVTYLTNSRGTYTVFFDDMDRLEEMMDKEEFYYLMISMINGAHALNKILPQKSKVVLLLRSDVVKMLHGRSGDINKPITSGGFELRWYETNARASNSPLMKMVFHKMKQSIDEDIKLSDIKERFFGKKESTLLYLMERTFGRPRDLVSFLNIYKNNFPDDNRITRNHLEMIEKEYSNWFHNEICNELKITGRFEEIDRVMKFISELGQGRFVGHKLVDFMEKRDGDTTNLVELLSILVSVGALGVELPNRNIEFRYRYYNIDKPVNIHTKFVVHHGLRSVLSINRGKQNDKVEILFE